MSRSMSLSMQVAVSRDTLFKAFTEASEMERWWPSAVESDPRTGGAFSYTFEMLEPSEPIAVRAGNYTSVVENESLAYPWIIPGMEPNTDVDIAFSGNDDQATVSLNHGGWSEDAAMDEVYSMHEQGWGGFFQNLKIVLEGGEDIRPGMMKMKTTG